MNIVLRSASALALATAALAASAQTVVNPGFETGSFSGWTTTAATNGSVFDVSSSNNSVYFPHAGTYFAEFGATAGLADTISQSIATVPGTRYTVSYYLLNNASNQATNTQSFFASFGGATETTGITTTTYSLHSFTGTATSAATTLTFGGYSTDRYYLLDDVSIVANPTPEPATIAALGLGAVAMLRRRKRA